MKNIISQILGVLSLVALPAFGQIVETHEFGTLNTQYYIYSDGKEFSFVAQNTMAVNTVDVKSVLASNIPATFHIEVRIEDSLIAKWDQVVNRISQYAPYYHTKKVAYSLRLGDTIVYKIYGNSFWTPEGGLLGINYVKLTGELESGVEFAEATPSTFVLRQNFPNPFNPTTNIRYGLPQKATLSLIVYNALGHQVATLVQGAVEAGYHQVTFNATGLPSGVYFYRLQAGDFTQTKRLVLLK
jgi:hypothetical protein